MNKLKSFIVRYNGEFIRVYKQITVDKLIKKCTNNMFEINIKDRLYIFNMASIKYILLGDGSVPSSETTRITIVFTDGDMKQFYFDEHKPALQLYNKLKQLVRPAE